MELQVLVAQAGELVNELSRAVEQQGIGLKEVEERILEYVNRIGDLLVQEVLERVSEPFTENRVQLAHGYERDRPDGEDDDHEPAGV